MKRMKTYISTALIAIGTVLVLGSGVLYGYQAWDNAQTAAEVRARVKAFQEQPSLYASPPASISPTAILTTEPTSRTTPTSSLIPPSPPPLPSSTPVSQPTSKPSPPLPLPTSTPTPAPALPVRLVIPLLGIDTPVVPVNIRLVDGEGGLVATWETADYAAGYHVGSALPGQPGNVVISGHNNIKGRVFRPISALGEPDVSFPKGALAYLYDAEGRVFAYAFETMYKFKEVGVPLEERIKNAQLMAPTSEPVLTLITCWPLNNNTHRIVVRARLVGEVEPSRQSEVLPLR